MNFITFNLHFGRFMDIRSSAELFYGIGFILIQTLVADEKKGN